MTTNIPRELFTHAERQTATPFCIALHSVLHVPYIVMYMPSSIVVLYNINSITEEVIVMSGQLNMSCSHSHNSNHQSCIYVKVLS